MTFVTHPQCSRCGLPFDHDPGGVMACGACLRAEPPFDRARAVDAVVLEIGRASCRERV
ncbi:unnamed protein product [Ectocarpus fasciculatus]